FAAAHAVSNHTLALPVALPISRAGPARKDAPRGPAPCGRALSLVPRLALAARDRAQLDRMDPSALDRRRPVPARPGGGSDRSRCDPRAVPGPAGPLPGLLPGRRRDR